MMLGPGPKAVGYVPGSMYKRFRLSAAKKMNRMAVQNMVNQMAAAGSLVFATTAAASEQRSVLAAQQLLHSQKARQTDLLQSLEGRRTSLLDVKV